MKNNLYLISFDIIISFIYQFFCNFKSYAFINCSFIIGMIYLLFGAICYVWEGGFFNIMSFSFNKIKQQIQKKRGLIDLDDEITLDEYILRDNKFKFTYNLLFSGLFISLSSTIISFFITI